VSDPLITALTAACRGEVRPSASLAGMSTLRVGGPARALVVAEDDDDLAAVGRICLDVGVPWFVVGRGSNLLVADAGWPGVAIQLGRSWRGVDIELAADHGTVRAGAAEPMPTLAVRAADAGLQGFAWAVGVPGTLGGGVRMNAGAHGGDMADHLVECEIVRLRAGVRETWPAATLQLGYRSSRLPDDAVVVGATLRLPIGDAAAVREEMAAIRAWRRSHQPLNEPNCGSVFTNPPGASAGALIDGAGLKGLRVGGASISTRHANFIVTRPGATAADVAHLIDLVIERISAATGIRLHPEVTRIGAFAAAGSR
jgi:UDP-N-acetylmuramate dehydrogenase